jgi:hypothetical protein
MNNCEFREIIISEGSQIENGVLGLDRDCYLSIVNPRFVSIKKSMNIYIYLNFPFMFFVVHWH